MHVFIHDFIYSHAVEVNKFNTENKAFISIYMIKIIISSICMNIYMYACFYTPGGQN